MKNWINRTINLGLYLSFCSMLGSGLLLHFRFDENLPTSAKRRILDMNWSDWAFFHYVSGLVLAGLVLLHLWMNRAWIVKILVERRSLYLLLALAVGAALIGGPLLLPAAD